MKKQCPDDEMLSGYIEGLLQENDKLAVKKHLEMCEHCLETVSVLNDLQLNLETVPKAITHSGVQLVNSLNITPLGIIKEKAARASRLVSGWVSEKLSGTQGWEMVPVRGKGDQLETNIAYISRQFEDLKVNIEIEKIGEDSALVRVIPIIYAPDIRVTLKRDEREISSYFIKQTGVTFESLKFNHYSLVFIKDRKTIGTCSFEIRDS